MSAAAMKPRKDELNAEGYAEIKISSKNKRVQHRNEAIPVDIVFIAKN